MAAAHGGRFISNDRHGVGAAGRFHILLRSNPNGYDRPRLRALRQREFT